MPGNRDNLIAIVEKQGATVRKTKKGLMIWMGDKFTVVHNTPSDRRNVKNEVAEFRRLGLVHPEDSRGKEKMEKEKREVKKGPGGYPAYLGRPVSVAQRKKFLAFLAERGYPLSVTVRELHDFGGNVTVSQSLYAVGYRYTPGKTPQGGYVWHAPENIEKLHWQKKQEATSAPEPEQERVPQPPVQVPPLEPKPTPPVVERHDLVMPVYEDKEPEAIDFIDERDSWVIDVEELLGEKLGRKVKERLSTLQPFGIKYEMRVWREKE